MGKPKVAIIDDSQPKEPAEEKKTTSRPIKRLGRQDDLIAKLQEELGVETKEAPKEKKKEVVKEAKKSEASKAKNPKSNRSKKYQETVESLNPEPAEGEEPIDFRTKSYKLNDAIELVKKASFTKFPGSLEAHINTSVTGIRGHITLPFASGKKLRVAAFGKGAENSGADLIGDEALLNNIKAGKINFDVLITTPEWMPKLAPLARVLGPKGLMPNPKSGTITEDLKKAVESYQGGKTEYKTEAKAKVIHMNMGKLTQPNEELEANIKTFLQTVGKSRVKKVTLAPTMGPGVKLDLGSI